MPEKLIIRCRENGPLLIQFPVTITDSVGNEFPMPAGKEVVALCRCGHSNNKPFCDGSHRFCGFVADETAPPAQ